MNLVSVIIPYFRKINFIEQCINSVLNQTYQKFEIIIIYDDVISYDYSFLKEIIKKDKRIRIIVNKKNLGPGLSRNSGIKRSRGNYIAFLDADDYWVKNKLEIQIKFMKKNLCSFSHTSYFLIDESAKIIGKRVAPRLTVYEDLLNSCDIGLSSVVLEKKIIKNLKFPNLKTKEDYVLWLKLSKKKIIINGLKKPLSYWRKLNNSLSSNILQKILDGYKVYRFYLKYDFFVSVYRLFILSFNYLKKKS